METTTHLGLKVVSATEWQTTLFQDFINAVAANDEASNMMLIDEAVGDLQSSKADLVDGKVPSSQLPDRNELQLGETENTAYRGDRGKAAYEHTQSTENPHQVTKSQVGLSAVDNTADADKPISKAVQSALDALSAQIGDISTLLDQVNGEVV